MVLQKVLLQLVLVWVPPLLVLLPPVLVCQHWGLLLVLVLLVAAVAPLVLVCLAFHPKAHPIQTSQIARIVAVLAADMG